MSALSSAAALLKPWKDAFSNSTAVSTTVITVHIIALLFDKSNPDEERRADTCYRELVSEFGKKGWASYRTGVNTMDLVAQQYGQVNRDFNQQIKDAIDPNHILAPGKSGIA